MPTKLLQGSYGVQKSTLDQITATAGNVQSGVKFLDKNGVIQTGTLSLSGNAGTGDVKSGKTFYSNSWTKQTGTLSLSGNASTSQVLSGRTFYSNSWTRQTGTMTNRGAVSKSINPGSSYTIPAGYHNGSGKVTANKENFGPWEHTVATGYTYDLSKFSAVPNHPEVKVRVDASSYLWFVIENGVMKLHNSVSGCIWVDGYQYYFGWEGKDYDTNLTI